MDHDATKAGRAATAPARQKSGKNLAHRFRSARHSLSHILLTARSTDPEGLLQDLCTVRD